MRSAIGCLVLCVAFSAHAADPGSYSGRVVAPDGTPFANASVVLPEYNLQPHRGETTTDVDGRFTLKVTNPPERELHRVGPALRIEVPDVGATYVDARQLTLFPGVNRDLGDIVLDAGRRYTGRVVDEDGQPLAGATVKCITYRFTLGHTVDFVGKEREVTTDQDGTFTTPVMPIGAPTIVARQEGYLTKYHDQDVVNTTGRDGRLPDFVLLKSKPIEGRVVTSDRRPVEGAKVNASGTETVSDADGRFVLHGFKDEDQVQLQIDVNDYTFINWSVKRTKEGYEHCEVADVVGLDDKDAETYQKAIEAITTKTPKLEIVVQPAAYITGKAIDAETGEPVKVSRIVICTFTRKENGEVVLNGCRMSRFEQPTPGAFSVEYGSPREYHLAVSAPGYLDGEAFTPPITKLQPIDDIVVKLTRKSRESEPKSGLRISGIVTENGKPLAIGRVGLWRPRRPQNAVNAYITRGRTTAGDGYVETSAIVDDGRYSLQVPYQDEGWYLIVETPDRIVAIEGPFSVSKDEKKEIDIKTRRSGSVRGRVEGDPSSAPLYAVLFSREGLQYEARVQADGSFNFANVLPGEYGLKIGSDTIRDREVPADAWDQEKPLEESLAIYALESDPWQRAVRVTVDEGETIDRLMARFEP